jgi:hypothetical protein
MHALELTRSDTYSREEGHDTPATLSMSMRLSLRLKDLRDQATGESASAATRQTGCGCFRMRALALRASTWQTRRGNAGSGALAPTQTHPAPHSSKVPWLIKVMLLPARSKNPVNPGQESVRTSGAPAHTPGALSPSLRA